MSPHITGTIQAKLDEELPGYTVAHYALVVGVERLNGADVESAVVLFAPDGQHPYITDGLLMHAERICERKAAE